MGGDLVNSISQGITVPMLLRLLREDRPLIFNDFSDLVSNNNVRRDRIIQMEEEGLVNVESIYSPRKIHRVTLSPLGISVAKLLNTIDSLNPDVDAKDKCMSMRYADPVLRLILSRTKIKFSEINNVLPYPDTLKKLYFRMEEEGLVKIGTEVDERRYKFLTLTPFGKIQAMCFQEIYDLMKNQS